MKNDNLAKAIYDCARACGFDNCGMIPMDSASGFSDMLQRRISNVPQSAPFYEHLSGLQRTGARFPWAKSIVILTFDYGKYRYPKELQGKYAKAFFLNPDRKGHSGYDLHRLEQWFAGHGIHAEGGEQFHAVSVGPLRYFAAKAGLGIIRKNNFFYTENGSYNDLVGYVIDRECELIQNSKAVPCSEKCDLCQSACKTKALQAPYTMNPFRCVSYCTTFGNSGVPQGVSAETLEGWICGCDNCQDACPHNRRHDWTSGEDYSNLNELASVIAPENYEHLPDAFLIEEVISKSAGHLQPSDVQVLRKNAARALAYQQERHALK